MKVKDFIERLTKYNNLDDEIIVDYIPYRDVEGLFENPLTKDEWKKFIMESEKQNYCYIDINLDYLYDIARKIREEDDE